MAERRASTTGKPRPDAQPGGPVPRVRSFRGREIRQRTDDEVVAILRELYKRHVNSVWFSLGTGAALGRSDIWYVRLNGRRLARARRLLGPERYERLVGPIREEWAAKLREVHAEIQEREELEAEIRATMDERYRSSAQARDPFPDGDIDG